MSVAVAHQAASSARKTALQEAAREARSRNTDLVVLHVVESVDLDLEAAYRSGLTDDVEAALASVDASSIEWRLLLATPKDDDVAGEILRLAEEANAEVLVIGARRRSPIGKFLLGSVTQTLILEADVPVVVVKAPA